MRGWGINRRGLYKVRRKEVLESLDNLEILEEQGQLSSQQLNDRVMLPTELLFMDDEEESYWSKRAGQQWLLHGDNNSAYFRRIANGRRRKHIIFQLHSDEGEVSGTDNLLKHASNYYKGLFNNDNKCNLFLRQDIWNTTQKLNMDEIEDLERPFTEAEIENAVDQMACNKAAGPDGFPVEFFQNCWSIIKFDVMNLFHAFHAHKVDLSRINYGSISLLPKDKSIEPFVCFLFCSRW